VIGLAETNVDWTQKPLTRRIEEAFRQRFKTVYLTYSCTINKNDPNLDVNHRPRAYKPGGTTTIVTKKYVGRARNTPATNPLGTVSCVTLQGRQGTALFRHHHLPSHPDSRQHVRRPVDSFPATTQPHA
jgi:hypothetical protein